MTDQLPETDVSSTDLQFEDALKKYGLSLSKSKGRKLDEYCKLLWDWNTRLNLTRHTDYDKFVSRDLVDSLALSEQLRQGERVLDIGSGGGVPGLLLAILRPDLKVELCDATGKKAMALSEMVEALRLDIPVHHAKAEAILARCGKGTRFTSLTIRAVSRMVDLLRMVGPYWTVFDRLLLVKGPKWTDERGEARHYNLLNKLALRCLKTYPTPTTEPETMIDSVILQICRKDDFDKLDEIIDTHKIERPEAPRDHHRDYGRRRFDHDSKPTKKMTKKSFKKTPRKKQA